MGKKLISRKRECPRCDGNMLDTGVIVMGIAFEVTGQYPCKRCGLEPNTDNYWQAYYARARAYKIGYHYGGKA